jgi:site-specific DNA recombinase
VQSLLADHARRGRESRSRVAPAILSGKLFDASGEAMVASFTHGSRGQVYRYYISASLARGERAAPGDPVRRRINANAIEKLVVEAMARLAGDEALDRLQRVQLGPEGVSLTVIDVLPAEMRGRLAEGEALDVDPRDPELIRVFIPAQVRARRSLCEIERSTLPPSTRRDPIVIEALRCAHLQLQTDRFGLPILAAAPASAYHVRRLRLALMAPRLQAAILEGVQPAGTTLQQVMTGVFPLLWREQGLG